MDRRYTIMLRFSLHDADLRTRTIAAVKSNSHDCITTKGWPAMNADCLRFMFPYSFSLIRTVVMIGKVALIQLSRRLRLTIAENRNDRESMFSLSMERNADDRRRSPILLALVSMFNEPSFSLRISLASVLASKTWSWETVVNARMVIMGWQIPMLMGARVTCFKKLQDCEKSGNILRHSWYPSSSNTPQSINARKQTEAID